ncbi:MAG: cytochrome c [Chthoniobacterales bacterium]
MKHDIFLKIGLPITLAAVSLLSLFGGEPAVKDLQETAGPDAAKLWAQNCQQCHNLRPATSMSDTQLRLVVHHMRLRAHITGEEQRAILSFLQEAN